MPRRIDENYRTGQKNAKGQTICGAKTRSGKPCASISLGPARRCRMHNGFAASGIAAPRYEGKGHSKYLPKRMQDDYRAAIENPDLLAVAADAALFEARILDVLQRVDTGESGEAWAEAQRALTELINALQESPPSPERQAGAVGALRKAIARGQGDWAAWRDLKDLVEQKRKLVETEQKRLLSQRVYVRVEQVMLWYDELVNALTRHINDPTTLSAIQSDWNRAVARTGQPALRTTAVESE